MPADTRTLSRTAGWLAFGYSLLVTGFMLWNVFQESDGAMLLLALLVIPWLAAPVVAAAAGAGASPTRLSAMTYLSLEIGLILFSIWSTVDMFLHGNSTAGIGILFLPIPEWGAFILIFLLSLACGWRMRPDFLKDEPRGHPSATRLRCGRT